MELTVKNVIEVLEEKYSECPACGNDSEVCIINNEIIMFCEMCGGSAKLAEVIKEIERKE